MDASANLVKVGGSTNKVNVSTDKREVFNVSNNIYTYDDAQAVCQAFGARLANYEEVESSYNDGGEWCNYGWSADQLILFPTQKSTWDTLQGKASTKNTCGRPGINGGYIANPNMRFGANCFGVKPAPTTQEQARLGRTTPRTMEDQVLEAKVDFWKKNRDKLMIVNPFNKDKWREY